MAQEEYFDSINLPWHYDPDVGVLIASPRDGKGDGAYRFAQCPETGHLVVEKNPCPTTAAVFQQRRDASLERVMLRVQAAVDAYASSPSSSSSEAEGEASNMNDGAGGLPSSAPPPPSPPPRQRRVTNKALAGCTITTLVRPTTGRTDLLVITPDGRSFRSKVAALRYLEDV